MGLQHLGGRRGAEPDGSGDQDDDDVPKVEEGFVCLDKSTEDQDQNGPDSLDSYHVEGNNQHPSPVPCEQTLSL